METKKKMKARAPLMMEHRLIETMVEVIRGEKDKIVEERTLNPGFVETVTDFFRTYADRTHHGKEEDILFKELSKKQMNQKDKELMQELMEEHKYAREIIRDLSVANEAYIQGDSSSINDILDKFDAIVELYPQHIAKEDKDFFPASEKYFTPEELDNMLEEFWDFDRKMIHEKYKSIVDHLKL